MTRKEDPSTPVTPDVPLGDLSREAVERLVQELELHQAELKAQNDDLRAAQTALIEARDRYTDLYDHAPTGHATLDAKGAMLELNLTLARMLGQPREQLLGQYLGAHTVPHAEAAALPDALETVMKAGPLHSVELLLRCANSETRWVRLDCRTAVSRNEPRALVRVSLSDITEARDARRRELEFERKLAETQRLETLGVLAGGIAHDFNNLLTAILGNASLALATDDEPTAVRTALEHIEAASMRAAELCSQLLAYAGGDGLLRTRPVRCGELVDEMARLLTAAVPKTVALSIEHTPDPLVVDADPTQLRQVVMNLLTNAAEAIGDSPGRVVVRTYQVADAASVLPEGDRLPHSLSQSPCVVFEVTDDGCGMDARTQARMFEPFFTTKFTGRGLGLAALQGIVRRHGGVVSVKSTPGKGTQVRVLLPLASRATAPAPPSHERAVTDGPQDRTVLVVDDEPQVRSLVVRALRAAGCQTLEAASGTEAVRIFEPNAGQIDAVVLDLLMPEMSGEETCARLLQLRDDLPVLLCSGSHDPRAFDWARDSRGHKRFLRKPFGPAELLNALNALLA